jgi:hypothetical protein
MKIIHYVYYANTIRTIHPTSITKTLHESEASICKAFKGEAIVNYCEPLIT